jgi:ribosomal protein S18 acetylase RimI-like enzyme
MNEGTDRPLAGRIRPGRFDDEDAVRTIADEVFAVFGEYGSWLPSYLSHQGVWSFVYEEAADVVGFAMLGIFEPERGGEERTGDLLAVAVKGSHQGRGIGTALIEAVTERARVMARVMRLREVRLTVAETNERARGLFGRFGFVPVDGDHGFYDKGQRALRLGLVLTSSDVVSTE